MAWTIKAKGMGIMDLQRERTCCFTGHRRIPEKDHLWVHRLLCIEILKLWREGVDCFLTGGALGFDTLAARAVLHLRQSYVPHIRLTLALPCKGQEKNWPLRDQNAYRAILQQADQAVCLSESYSKSCMFQRDRYLVDHSGHCLCWMKPDAKRGGTLYTVNYAKKSGIEVTNLYPPPRAGVPASPLEGVLP